MGRQKGSRREVDLRAADADGIKTARKAGQPVRHEFRLLVRQPTVALPRRLLHGRIARRIARTVVVVAADAVARRSVSRGRGSTSRRRRKLPSR
jgi:hypothetical protein